MLDVEMVSASCPKCTIYLIEAQNSISDLEKAETEAVTLGAHIVSNSWICYGDVQCGDSNFASHFNTPGVVYLAASGDDAYNQNGAPEALANVVSVGGTIISKNGSTYSETVWPDAGSGCAPGITKPSWQHDTGCTSRTDSDVSAVAQFVAEYDSLDGGWFTVARHECRLSAYGGSFWACRKRQQPDRREELLDAQEEKIQERAARYHLGKQRLLRWQLSVHRSQRLRRPDRLGNAQRHQGLLV